MQTTSSLLCGIFGCIIALGVLGNAVVASFFMAVKTLRRPANIFIVNMALCDSIFMLTFVPVIIKASLRDSWVITHTQCQVFGLTQFLSSGASIVCMAQLAFSRYVAVLRRNWMKHFRFRVTVPLAAISWLWVALFLTPLSTNSMRVIFYPNMHGCMADYSFNPLHTVFLVLGIFSPASVLILVCYWKIFKEFRLRSSRVNSHVPATEGHQVRKAEFLFALQLFLIFVLFEVSMAPPIIIVVAIDPTATKLSGDAFLLVQILVIVNSALCPFLYLVFHKPFSANFVRKISCKKANVPDFSNTGETE